MIKASNPYDDPILVPANWYAHRFTYQTVCGSGVMGYPPGFEPVVLRGALHCRIHNHGSARNYGTEVLTRYVRAKRITETDPIRWYDWLREVLLPMAANRNWWPWQRKCLDDLQYFVSEYSAVIDGEVHRFYDPAVRRNLKALHKAMKTVARGVQA